MDSADTDAWAHAVYTALVENGRSQALGDGGGHQGGSRRHERGELSPPLTDADAVTGDGDSRNDNGSDDSVLRSPPITTSGGIIMSEENNKSEEAPMNVEANKLGSDTRPSSDLTAEIAENNTELTEQIVNAIALANSISGITSERAADPLKKLENLLPGGKGIGTAQALGPSPLAPPGAPIAAPGAGAVPELAILSLLSSTSNYLTPTEMALPLNDPSIFMPTPFAPGQDANTLIQRRQQDKEQAEQEQPQQLPALSPTIPATFAPIDSASPAPAPPAATPAAPQPQQQLLQQLASAYDTRVQQTIFPARATGGGPIPPSLMKGRTPPIQMSGNLNPMVNGLHLFSGLPQGLNHGRMPQGLNLNNGRMPQGLNLNHGRMSQGLNNGISSGFNGPIAGIPAAPHPELAMVPAALNHPGTAPFTYMGNSTTQSTVTESPAAPFSIHTNHPNTSGTTTSMLRQPSLKPDEPNGFNVQSTAALKMPMPGDSVPQPQPDSLTKKSKPSSSAPQGSDLLIKSREARWIIRYNELLEFRGEHGHCRVPHGYAANRKLSWWVMNQRAQFAHRNQGKKTWLTDDRIQLLNDIGFIWTPHLKRSGAGKKEKAAETEEKRKEEEGSDNSNKASV